jgi:integrase
MPKEQRPLPKGIPRTLRFESIAFEVIALGDGRLAFGYYEGDKRVVVKRQTIDALREEAQRIATAILNADSAAKSMTADDCRIYVAARNIIAPLKIALDQGARILLEAAQLVGDPHRIIEACRSFSQQRNDLHQAPSATVVEHYIRNLRGDELSDYYIEKMEEDLAKFTAKFPGPLPLTKAGEMDDWLRSLKKDNTEEPIGLRRRRNLRDKLVGLFNFARTSEYLPDGLITEAEKIKRPRVKRKAPQIYSPEEVDLMFTQCMQAADKKIGRKDYSDFLPCIAIAAFAGLRWEEIMNLDWSKVHYEEGVIEVGDEDKTGHRKVPILENLMSWLSPYRGSFGPVCKHKRPDAVVRRLRKRAGLQPGGRKYANAFRHSYVTFRVAVTKNMPLVANDSGHSVAELRKSYNRGGLERVGIKYFSLYRDASNVVQMPLLSMRSQGDGSCSKTVPDAKPSPADPVFSLNG